MNPILQDASKKSSLFIWNGPVQSNVLQSWLEERKLDLPFDLISFWEITGGGNVFESEQILGPFGDEASGEDIDSNNRWQLSKGMPEDFLFFNTGVFPSAIRLSDKKYILIDENTYQAIQEFATLADWYCGTLRLEFAKRYGLE